MDRKIEKKKWTKRKKITWLISVVLIALLSFFLYKSFIRQTIQVDKKRLSFATISKGGFQEYILEKEVDFLDDWEDNLLMLRYDSKVLIHDYKS